MSGQPFCKTKYIARALGGRIKTGFKDGDLGILSVVLAVVAALLGIYVLHEYILIRVLSESLEKTIRAVERAAAASAIVGLLLFTGIMMIRDAIRELRSLHSEATEECDRG